MRDRALWEVFRPLGEGPQRELWDHVPFVSLLLSSQGVNGFAGLHALDYHIPKMIEQTIMN